VRRLAGLDDLPVDGDALPVERSDDSPPDAGCDPTRRRIDPRHATEAAVRRINSRAHESSRARLTVYRLGDPANQASDDVAVPNGAQPATESRVETRSIRSRRIRTPHRRSVALASGSAPVVAGPRPRRRPGVGGHFRRAVASRSETPACRPWLRADRRLRAGQWRSCGRQGTA